MDLREKQIKDVEDVLHYSDIVWSKYGTESIHELATKIIDKLNKPKEELTYCR